MTGQVRRAAVSVAAISAEGAGRRGSRDFLHILGIASSSPAEMETTLILARCLGMASPDHATPLLTHAAEVSRTLSGLNRSINARIQPLSTGRYSPIPHARLAV